MESLIGRLLAFYVFPMLGIVLVHEASVSWYDALLELLVFPVYIGITKLLKLDFTDLKVGFQRQYFNRFLLPNGSFHVCVFSQCCRSGGF